jgi:hypothetical protein
MSHDRRRRSSSLVFNELSRRSREVLVSNFFCNFSFSRHHHYLDYYCNVFALLLFSRTKQTILQLQWSSYTNITATTVAGNCVYNSRVNTRSLRSFPVQGQSCFSWSCLCHCFQRCLEVSMSSTTFQVRMDHDFKSTEEVLSSHKKLCDSLSISQLNFRCK